MSDRFLLPIGDTKRSFVSRAGQKLDAAIATLQIPVAGLIAADLGCNVGGFTDCLLQHGAVKVYAVDTAYGVLAWTLRKDPRVVVRERTNALHVKLPEPVDIVAIDVGWTRQEKILPIARTLLRAKPAEGAGDSGGVIGGGTGGGILTLIKPHYESELAKTQGGVLTPEQSSTMLEQVVATIERLGFLIRGIVKSPIEGQKGNTEFVAHLEWPG